MTPDLFGMDAKELAVAGLTIIGGAYIIMSLYMGVALEMELILLIVGGIIAGGSIQVGQKLGEAKVLQSNNCTPKEGN